MENFDINAFLADAQEANEPEVVTVNETTGSHGFLKFIGGVVIGVVATKLVDFALNTRRQWVEDHLAEIRRRIENGETPEDIAASEKAEEYDVVTEETTNEDYED